MSKLTPIQIDNSVGRMARNNMRDVRTVQERFNLLMAPSWQPLKPDGIAGPITQGAIGRFQEQVLGFRNPDRRVDPRGRTIKALNDAASATKWHGGPPPGPDNPPRPVTPSGAPTIPIFGTTDFRGGFDTFPPPRQVLNYSTIIDQPPRDGAWIMIPRRAERVIRVGLRPDLPVAFAGRGVHHEACYNALKKKVFSADRVASDLVRIRGTYPCQDFALDIVQGDRYARLYVSVKPLRVVPLIVRYVEQRRNFRILLSGSELRRAIGIANDIVVPQSNVRIKLLADSVLPFEEIGRRVGRVIDGDEFEHLAKFNQNVNFQQEQFARAVPLINVYVVRKIKNDMPGTVGLAYWNRNTIFLDDRSYGRDTNVHAVGRALAHEVGHILLRNFFDGWKQFAINIAHNPFGDALMYPSLGGSRLYRAEIEKFNPSKLLTPHYDPTVFM